MMKIPVIGTEQKLIQTVAKTGFLPFFVSGIEGFSLEEHVSESAWYNGGSGGRVEWPAWDWKGSVLRSHSLVYGKFFDKKAGFISPEWFPDFCNMRRDGYDFDARYEDGLASFGDKGVIDHLESRGALLTAEIKKDLNYVKGGNKGFETVITRLQMQTYVVPCDYEYSKRRNGEEYGWGNCRYDIADRFWGEELCRGAYGRSPEESRERIIKHLMKVLPGTDRETIAAFLK
jgi:hypothetical protein